MSENSLSLHPTPCKPGIPSFKNPSLQIRTLCDVASPLHRLKVCVDLLHKTCSYTQLSILTAYMSRLTPLRSSKSASISLFNSTTIPYHRLWTLFALLVKTSNHQCFNTTSNDRKQHYLHRIDALHLHQSFDSKQNEHSYDYTSSRLSIVSR